MKAKYDEILVEIIVLDTEDVITSSTVDGDDDTGTDLPSIAW